MKQLQDFIDKFNLDILTVIFTKNQKPSGYVTFDTDNIDFDFLINKSKQKNEIFFMVNQGDGYIYEGKKTPRSKKNVNKLTSLFIDTDAVPFNVVKAYLKQISLTPHLIVESSPKKYHLYFVLEEYYNRNDPKFQGYLKRWQTLQLKLSHLGTDTPKTDSSMKDYSRLLRLPFFYHLKNLDKPFQTRIVQEYHHDKYNLDELEEIILSGQAQSQPQQVEQNQQNSSYSLPNSTVNTGNRHFQMTSHLGYLLTLGVAEEIAIFSFYSLAHKYFVDYQDFLPNGKRNQEVLDFIKYKNEDIEQSKIKENNIRRVEMLKKYEDKKDVKTRFDLPDDFYFNAPGLTGAIVREICASAPYPIPSISFAVATSLISILKGKSAIDVFGIPANSYFLCLAPTGAGKSYPQEVIRHTLHSLNKQFLMESKVRSDRGILNWLNRNDGVGLFLSDEVEELLISLNSERSGQHIRNFKTLLLELYSAHNMRGLSFGEITSRKEEAVILNEPRFSTVLIGTPDIINTAFTQKTITSGLFQRFNILYTDSGRALNPSAKSSKAFNKDILDELKTLSSNSVLNYEKVLNGESVVIEYDKKAMGAREDLRKYYDELYNKELKSGSGLEGVYTRSFEKGCRLANCLSEKNFVTLEIFHYAQDFIEKNSEALFLTAKESIIGGGVSKELEELEEFIFSNCDIEGKISYRDILRKFKVRDSKKLKELLRDAEEVGIVSKIDNQRQGLSRGKKGVIYKI